MSKADLKARIETLESRVEELEQKLPIGPSPEDVREEFDFNDSAVDPVPIEENVDTYSHRSMVLDRVANYERAYDEPISRAEVLDELLEHGCSDEEAQNLLDELLRHGALYEPDDGHLRVV